MNVTQTIAKYALQMRQRPYWCGDAPRILLKHDGRCYSTAQKADFSKITREDVVDITGLSTPESEVLMASKDCNAMILSNTPYLDICIASRHPIEAVLDDMAQVIGSKVDVVPYTEKDIKRALKNAEAVMVAGKYSISCGRNLYEAFVTMCILEKSAEIMLKSAVLGGAKPISGGLTRAMRKVYKSKYSRLEMEHKDDFEG